jgi:hypothetical protein
MFGNQAFAYDGYGDYGGYPYGDYYDLGHYHQAICMQVYKRF